jgi:hypothetical protein
MREWLNNAFDVQVRRPLQRSGILLILGILVGIVVGLIWLCTKYWRTAITLAAAGFMVGSGGWWAPVQFVGLVAA